MPQQGDIVEFVGRSSIHTSWKCVLGDVRHLHQESVKVKLGPNSGGRFNNSECLIHPNHRGAVRTDRRMTVIVPNATAVTVSDESA